jgi:alpha-maltose-1-phosphate synthase
MTRPAPPPRISVGHSGKQHAYHLAEALQRLGHLEKFVTSGYYKPLAFPDRIFARSTKFDRLLRRRHLESLDECRVVRRWDLELPELICRALVGSGRAAHALVCARDARFDHWSARRYATHCDIYWGFQGSCLASLRASRKSGAIAVAEFAAAHITCVSRLLATEAARHPEWADTIGALQIPRWYRRRLETEPHEADYCIAASGFAKKSLLEVGVPDSKIKILPLGADLIRFNEVPRHSTGKLRVLFVGKISQAKGVKYLLEAIKKIHSREVELVLVGPLVGSGAALAQYSGLFTWLGRLDQQQVVEEMCRSHVLVLPSILEGFGLVIPEAMATGMPVIASTNSIGPEIIENGRDGFVLEPDDVEGLAEQIDWLAAHREQACQMGQEAARKANRFSWKEHERRLGAIIHEIWDGRSGPS